MVTFEFSDWRNGPIWWIQSVYVAPGHRRRGIYRALHDHVRSAAQEAGAVGLRLYVDRQNKVAKATYRSLGMEPSRYDMYEEIWG
jgi:ribosomal protein S18 acetylase RimI-like enzyme